MFDLSPSSPERAKSMSVMLTRWPSSTLTSHGQSGPPHPVSKVTTLASTPPLAGARAKSQRRRQDPPTATTARTWRLLTYIIQYLCILFHLSTNQLKIDANGPDLFFVRIVSCRKLYNIIFLWYPFHVYYILFAFTYQQSLLSLLSLCLYLIGTCSLNKYIDWLNATDYLGCCYCCQPTPLRPTALFFLLLLLEILIKLLIQ